MDGRKKSNELTLYSSASSIARVPTFSLLGTAASSSTGAAAAGGADKAFTDARLLRTCLAAALKLALGAAAGFANFTFFEDEDLYSSPSEESLADTERSSPSTLPSLVMAFLPLVAFAALASRALIT